MGPDATDDGETTTPPRTGEGATGRERAVWDALYEVNDPEMPISVVDLGLVYDVEVDDEAAVVDFTLTYSGCPAKDMLLEDVEAAVEDVDGVDDVRIELVWSPEWSQEMITEAGREELREYGLSV